MITLDMIIKDDGQSLQKHELYKIRETGSRLRQIGALPSSKNPHFQNEAKCTTFRVKMSFTCMRMKNHFHIKG